MTEGLNFRQEYRVTTFVAVAMISALVVYAALVTIIQFQHQPFVGFAPERLGQLREGFFLAILFVLVGVRMSRKSVLKKGTGDSPKTLVNKLRTATIVTFALCEVPAILGLVLFLLGGSAKDFYSLALVSLAFMVLYFPRYRHWETWVVGSAGIY
jgi:F0F1-type ATP synthase membrane subunit c/vacuolar-type H+-ATPase subunit K